VASGTLRAQFWRMEAATHRFEAHTGEVQVELRAPDLPGLYREAALALAEVMAPGATCGADAAAEEVEVEARDPAALLVEWIDELIYRVDVTGKVYPSIEVESADGRRLRARVRGCVPERFKTAVKAATFHDLAIRETEDGYSAHLVLDV